MWLLLHSLRQLRSLSSSASAQSCLFSLAHPFCVPVRCHSLQNTTQMYDLNCYECTRCPNYWSSTAQEWYCYYICEYTNL